MFFELSDAQNIELNYYNSLKENYQNYSENASCALPFVKKYIHTSKKKNNYTHLTQAYKDAVFYTASGHDKIKYSDSMINAAFLSKNNNLITDAFLSKGIVYHLCLRRHKPALDEYMKAYQYSKSSADGYVKNILLYHISSLKSHLGYYDSAIKDFKNTTEFFYRNSQRKAHTKTILKNKKVYYNSLIQMIICHRNLKDFKPIDSLIAIGLDQTQNSTDFRAEYGYFLREMGIEQFRRKKLTSALPSLKRSLTSVGSSSDFAWAPVNYFYIGQIFLASGDQPTAMAYFKKVDSVFQEHLFIRPEIRESYEFLIEYYKAHNNDKQELYYTKQLLKADRTINKDYPYLSSTIHKHYDTATLTEERDRLERKSLLEKILGFSLILAVLAIIIIVCRKLRNERNAKINYRILEDKLINSSCVSSCTNDHQFNEGERCTLDEKTAENILKKLQIFEQKHGFIEQGLTINKLAIKLRTNSNYLSQVINECKGMNFNRYLSELRIKYITDKLYNDQTYLKYKIESLGQKCGISSRTNFSNLFHEINGIRPKDFIKNRLRSIEEAKEVLKI